jgi:glycosyltransferase involved in cell wall biosynthesis
MSRDVLMASSVPLAAPWNGADKLVAALIVRHDTENRYIIHTSESQEWPDPSRIRRICTHRANPMPTRAQKLRGFGYLLRNAFHADLLHVVASIHGEPRLSAAFVRAVRKVTRRPLVHTIPSLGDRPLRPRLLPGDVSVVFSRHSSEQLARYGVENVVRLTPPIDLDRLRPGTPPERLRQELGIGERAILSAGHYGRASGLEALVEAFARLPADLADATLVLAYRHHPWQDARRERAGVMDLAARAGVAARTRLLGRVDDMPALIAACATTVLVPRSLESKMDLPLIVLESLALGRPAIVSAAPPASEALLGQGGVAVAPGDPIALAGALTELLRSPTTARAMGERGRAAALEACDPRRVVERYQEVYAMAMAAPPRIGAADTMG